MSVRKLGALPMVIALVLSALGLWGCSADPTASDEYLSLEDERTALERDLVSVEADRAALEAQLADLEVIVGDVAIPADIAQVLVDYVTAYISNDADAYGATVTDDFVVEEISYFFQGTGGIVTMPSVYTRDEMLTELTHTAKVWQTEVGTPIGVSGGGPWYVSQTENWHEESLNDRWIGVATYVVVDDGGTLKVRHKYNVGFWSEHE